MRVGIRRLPLVVGLAVLATALLPAAANAAWSVSGFSATTLKADDSLYTQAGGVPDRGITITSFSGNPAAGEVIRNLRVDVPPGLITSIASVPTCDNAVAATCPAASQIGTTTLTVSAGGPPFDVGPLPVYNMAPPAGRISEFAFSLPTNPRVKILGGVRWDTDYGTYFELNDIPAPGGSNPLILSTNLTFFGNPADHVLSGTSAPFVRLPTFCGPPYTTKVTAEAWNGAVATATDTTPSGATGCDQVPFTPSLTTTPSTTKRDSPTGADVTLNLPDVPDPADVGQSHVKDTSVTLPEGMTINPSVANGLETCTDAQFGKGTTAAVTCPAAAKVGTAKIVSAAVPEPLTGDVWLGQPEPGNPYRIFLQAIGAGVDTRLIGSVKADPLTGRLTTTFADTPQTPFTEFTISLSSGPRAVFATPLACGPGQSTSVLTPWSGQANATPSATTAAFDANGAGAPCDGTPFAPGFAAATSSSQAAGDTSFTADVTRPDGQQFLSRLSVKQPNGLLGRIPLVPQCSNANADAAACSDSSRIGTASVLAGAGTEPYALSGPVYLTESYGGAPFGLAIVIRAVAGPYDLGTVVVRAAIRIDPVTAAITVDGDALPTILQGIPLRLREVKVTIDKQGFLFNGTNCTPQTASGASTSTSGATSAATTTVPVTGCDKLAFTPKLTGWTDGRQTQKSGAALYTTLRQPGGQVNLRSVSVQLPTGFSARGTTLQKACLRSTFIADPTKCPKESAVGNALAVTPTLPFDLTGVAYLVARETGGLPTIEVVLNRNLVKIQFGSEIDYSGRYTATFAPTPDAPVTQFRLNFPAGTFSSLVYTSKTSLCSRALTLPTTFTGQDGRTVKQNAPLNVENCPVRITGKKTVSRGRAQLTVRVPESGKLTVSGKGIVTRTITRATPARALKISVLRRSPTVRSSVVTVRLVPGKKAQAASPVRLTPSSARTTVRFGAAARVRPTFTG